VPTPAASAQASGAGAADAADGSSCHERADGPTRDACVAVVAHLGKVMPADMDVEHPEQDVCECLAMPQSLIACFAAIESRSDADACVDAYEPSGSGAGARPGPRGPAASRAECAAAVAHLAELDPTYAEQIDGDEAAVIGDCVQNATVDDVKCILAADTAEAVGRCGR
jgi:hypothetical protein